MHRDPTPPVPTPLHAARVSGEAAVLHRMTTRRTPGFHISTFSQKEMHLPLHLSAATPAHRPARSHLTDTHSSPPDRENTIATVSLPTGATSFTNLRSPALLPPATSSEEEEGDAISDATEDEQVSHCPAPGVCAPLQRHDATLTPPALFLSLGSVSIKAPETGIHWFGRLTQAVQVRPRPAEVPRCALCNSLSHTPLLAQIPELG